METVLVWYDSLCGAVSSKEWALCPADVRAAFDAHAWNALTWCERVLRGPVVAPGGTQMSASYVRALRVLRVVSAVADVHDFPRAEDVRRAVAQLEYDIEPALHQYEQTCEFARACDIYSRLPRKRKAWDMTWCY